MIADLILPCLRLGLTELVNVKIFTFTEPFAVMDMPFRYVQPDWLLSFTTAPRCVIRLQQVEPKELHF